MQKIIESESVRMLLWQTKDDTEYPVMITDENGERVEYITTDKKFVKYLLDPTEMFARAYAQWVTTRSYLPGAKEFIHDRTPSGRAFYWEQWDDEDFAPIAKALDKLFSSYGYQARKR